jgi:hypothetical protein
MAFASSMARTPTSDWANSWRRSRLFWSGGNLLYSG